MRLKSFRRIAWWLTLPRRRLPYGVDDRGTAFRAGQWQAADEVWRAIEDGGNGLDALQAMEREAHSERLADTVQARTDS